LIGVWGEQDLYQPDPKNGRETLITNRGRQPGGPVKSSRGAFPDGREVSVEGKRSNSRGGKGTSSARFCLLTSRKGEEVAGRQYGEMAGRRGVCLRRGG